MGGKRYKNRRGDDFSNLRCTSTGGILRNILISGLYGFVNVRMVMVMCVEDAFALPHSGDLQALLHRLIEMLESMKCKSVASSLIDFYLHAAIHVGLLTLFELFFFLEHGGVLGRQGGGVTVSCSLAQTQRGLVLLDRNF